MLGLAGTVLQQQGNSYLQKGQAFMQSKMGFLSGGVLHYHFSVTGQYGMFTMTCGRAPACCLSIIDILSSVSGSTQSHHAFAGQHSRRSLRVHSLPGIAVCAAVSNKLLMLLAPFLRQWNYTRVAEQVSSPGMDTTRRLS